MLLLFSSVSCSILVTGNVANILSNNYPHPWTPFLVLNAILFRQLTHTHTQTKNIYRLVIIITMAIVAWRCLLKWHEFKWLDCQSTSLYSYCLAFYLIISLLCFQQKKRFASSCCHILLAFLFCSLGIFFLLYFKHVN